MNKFCEKRLRVTAKNFGIKPEQVPRHIAIIMDGNGRWAQNKGLPRGKGHLKGAKTVERIAQDCSDWGIEFLTLYSFSVENWKRPRTEVNYLMHLYAEYLVGIRPMLKKNNVKLVHIGQPEQLPDRVKTELTNTMNITANNKGMILALALNYSSRAEITDAAKKIASEYKAGKLKLKDITDDCFNKHLYTAGLNDPDLLIRTANEMRISNFLLWQISYSEFYVTKTLWPNFNKADLKRAIIAYSKRNRRFGGLNS